MLDERVRSSLDNIIRDMLMPGEIGTDSYLYNLRRVVLTLGHQGDVIIIGRAAGHILPGQFGLYVRLVAPLEERIQRVAEREGLTQHAARERIREADRERAKFIRRYFARDEKDPLNYDLIINTGGKAMEAVAEFVLAALRQKLGVIPCAP